jgi:hypothetical protein
MTPDLLKVDNPTATGVSFIPSTQDYICGDLIVAGTLVNDNKLRVHSMTMQAGSTYVALAGSLTEVNPLL